MLALAVTPVIVGVSGSGVTSAACTVIAQVAVLLPSAVVTVIVAVPSLSAVTTPFATVATVSSDDDQLTCLLLALEGDTVATKVAVTVAPILRVTAVWSSVTPVTAMVTCLS